MGIPARAKFIRFIICEAITLALLLVSLIVGVHERNAGRIAGVHQSAVSLLITTGTIASAVAAALVPIIFFGPERLR